MKKKLVLTGKAVLSTVMASTMACSMLSTNILAQEPEVVPEEETTVEKTPVEEETTATEEATEVVEEEAETPEIVTAPSNTVTLNDTVDKSELKAWIDKINALNPDDYTQESWNKLQGDLDVAEMFYDLDGFKQEEIDLVVDRLEQNFNALVPADKTAPTVDLSYEVTDEGVKVTLTADEAIQSINGWTKVSDTQYQRVYAGAVDETITVYDLAGNEAEVQLTLADKTALKEAIENFGNLEGSGSVYDNYVKVLNNGKALLEDPEATQVKVDNAARNIETCYYKVFVAALNTKYDPDTFDYSKYTTDSIIPVQNMYGITHNRTNNNYQENEAQGNIGQMKGWYEEYLKAEAGLTLADQDEKYIGLNTDALSSSSKKQGNFNVIKQEIVNVDGTYKIQLTMEFINDGLHPIYGSELPNANGSTKFSKFSFGESDAKKARVHTYDSKMGASRYVTWQNVSKLDGQDSWSKGFKGTIILEPDEEYVTFEFKKGFSDVAYSPWYYHVQPMDTTAPTVELSYEMTEEGVKVTLTANEAIQSIDGWTKVSDTQYQRVYAGAVDETITVYDLAGNKAEVQLTLADKTALKEAIKNFGNLEGSGSVYDNYVKVLNNGKALLEDPEATQVKVDNAARNIETCYYKVLVAALNTKYDPDTFDYSKYTTGSIIPVQNMYGITHNRTNNNYQENEAQGNIGQMKGWYEEYLKAEAGLTLAAQDEKYIGFNPESTSVDDRQGHFAVTSQEVVVVDGVKKIRLHVSFYNDGLHPIYGAELPNANGSTKFNKFSIGKNDIKKTRVHTYNSSFGSKRSAGLQNVTYLDGETSYSKGFQGTFDINDGEQYVTFEYTKDRDSTYSPWYYNIQPMDMVDPECTVTYSNNGNPTNEDVTVTIQANEQLQPVEGWTLSDDGMSLTKTYSDNTSETVTVKDLTGNAIEVPVNVTGIDKLGPTVTVKNETTEDGVLVTIETSEPIQTPDGWTKVSDTKYTKLYTENTSEDIIVYDLAGNATKAHVTVSSISKPGTGGSDQNKNQGTDTKKEDSKKTDGTNTGVFVGTGLFAGSATAAAAGASLLAFLKKRKK